MKKTNKKGFTLAELLIVVAIIAVLVAIAIPVFTSQLEKARESTDLANIRSAYAEVIIKAIEDPAADDLEQNYTLKQTESGWKTVGAEDTLEDICGDSAHVTGSPEAGGTATISWVPGDEDTDGYCQIVFATGA